MPLRAEIRYPRIDIDRSVDEIHRVMSELVVEACKTWVISTTDFVPVLTGASKASFLKLAFHARTTLSITPRIKSRIPLGIETSEGEIFAEKGISYGWRWSSGLDYIQIVDRHNAFLAAGERSLQHVSPVLPQPVIKR